MNSVCCNDASGLTPLHIAVNASNMKAVEILLAKGADVNCHETKRGRSALHLAVKKQAKDLISLLLRSVSSPPHFEHFSNMEQ
jgi:ankyrin repeat protein